MRKQTICIGENKGADQLPSNCEADQRLCFSYRDSTIPLLLKSKISSFCDCIARFSLSLEQTDFKIPFINFKPFINEYVLNEWQSIIYKINAFKQKVLDS